MNNNTTKQIDATTQRSTSNLVSTQSARERSVREISTQVDKHKANKHRCTKWHKSRTNRYHCQIRYTSAVTLFQIHGCKARDINDSTFVDEQINYYKQEAVHNNYGERIHHRQWKVVKQTNKQKQKQTNKISRCYGPTQWYLFSIQKWPYCLTNLILCRSACLLLSANFPWYSNTKLYTA